MKLGSTLLTITFAVLLGAASATGCGSESSPAARADAGSIGARADGGSNTEPCVGLCLRQKECGGGQTTSLSGTVTDPAGKIPLYNVVVYVPNAPVAPIVQGATCDRCGSISGSPLVATLTGVDGKFKLDNVPVGANVPLVVQIGKWRRQITIPNVADCTDTPLDVETVRLPRKKSEGDIPHIALTTGGADVMECWLRKVGIDDSEFTVGTGDGRVHFYQGSGADPTTVTTRFKGGATFSPAQELWSSEASLAKYDIVILSCEGVTAPATKPPEALAAMKAYANAGGRVFASHWHRFWFTTGARPPDPNAGTPDPGEAAGPVPSPFEPFATWNDRDDPINPSFGTINTSFPKGEAMQRWLRQPAVGALCPVTGLCDETLGDVLPIADPRHNADAVDPAKATSWITIPNGVATAQEYLSFNTPIPAAEDQKCGRVVYSDLHVTTADAHGDWPSGCQTSDLTPQEKALEFMLFDLSSCIQSDQTAPAPPSTGGVN